MKFRFSYFSTFVLSFRFLIVVLLVAIFLANLPSKHNLNEPQRLFTVSAKTSYYTAPVDQYGFVNYISAINAELSIGVSPENNAAPYYIRASRVSSFSPDYLQRLCQLLNIPVPQLGSYIRSYEEELKKVANSAQSTSKIENQDQWVKAEMDLVNKPWKAVDIPLAKEFLDQYQPTFELLKLATEKSHYWCPYVGGDQTDKYETALEITPPHTTEMRYFARALNIKIMLDLGEKDYQAAKDDLVTARIMAQHFTQGGTNIEQLVGFACHANVLKAEIEFLNRCSYPNILKEYATCIERLPKSKGIYYYYDKIERVMMLDAINAMARHEYGVITEDDLKGFFEIQHSLSYKTLALKSDWDIVAREINQTYNRMLTYLKLERKSRINKLQALDVELEQIRISALNMNQLFWNLTSKKARSEYLGKFLASMSLPHISKGLIAEETASVRQQLSQIALQLNLYKHENGKYPVELSSLSPRYLKDIPDDLFAGAPFKYTSDGINYKLYSIGRNEVDDGGQGSELNSEFDDIVAQSNY